MCASDQGSLKDLVDRREKLQELIDVRLDAINARLRDLAVVRQQLRLRQHPTHISRKRPRGVDGRERVVFVGDNIRVPYCVWDQALDGALCAETTHLRTTSLLAYDASLWAVIHRSFMKRVGFNACTALECFLRWRQIHRSGEPFRAAEDAALCAAVVRTGCQWQRVTTLLLPDFKKLRTPVDLAHRWMALHPDLFWGTYLSRHTIWANVRHLIEFPAFNLDSTVTRLHAATRASAAWSYATPKPVSVQHAVENAVVDLLRSVDLQSYLELLLHWLRDRLPVAGLLFEELILDASACSAQLSMQEMASSCHCTEHDIRKRIQDALLEQTRSSVLLNVESMSRRLFGHTRCAKMVLDVACELEKWQPGHNQ